MKKEQITKAFQELQDEICNGLESVDGGVFRQDLWERPGGGGGRTRIITGNHIEKGGVNFSAVHGPMPEKITNALGIGEGEFFATGVSIVLHPVNPHVPIIHMNVRYFEMDNGLWWFGGGIDLTPHFVVLDDVRFFHGKLKDTCDRHDLEFYPKFRDWADKYFYIKHRKETRGVGGIFFDRLNDGEKQAKFDFTLDVGKTFLPIYLPLIKDNMSRPFSEREKEWQYLRRGRYVEFNLVWDKGTKFGLDTDGRTESILMSMPSRASWTYNHKPEPDSPEMFTLKYLKGEVEPVSL